jgi:hypothetical protein
VVAEAAAEAATLGVDTEAAAAAATVAAAAEALGQGLTLVHFSAQLEHFLLDRGHA